MLTPAVTAIVRQTPDSELLPYPLDKKVHREAACAVAKMAIQQGIACAE
jgi:malic enzyme